MLVRESVIMNEPFADVEVAFFRRPGAWLPIIAHDRGHWASDIKGRVGTSHVSKRVVFELGAPLRGRACSSLPFRWTPTGFKRYLPTLHGALTVRLIEHARTALEFEGQYTPPFGRFGAWLDRGYLHRVATSTARDLLEHAGRRLATLIAEDRAGITVDP